MNYFERKRKYLIDNTKKEYIKNGLQLWLDGIENKRTGHSSVALGKWEDLSGNNYDFSLVSGAPIVPENDGLTFTNRVYACSNENLMDLLTGVKKRTIEIVCEIDDSDTTAKTILMGASKTSPSEGIGMWYRPASKGMCIVSTTEKARVISDITNPHTYTAVYNSVSLGTTSFYQDNSLCSSVAGGSMANIGQVTLGGRYYSGNYLNYRFKGKIYCVRVYDRQLTKAEIEHNRKIDKERFGI